VTASPASGPPAALARAPRGFLVREVTSVARIAAPGERQALACGVRA
jgi:hypothetical protein